jgi:hypothetical protein
MSQQGVGSRPTNKTNKEKETNILVLLFNPNCFVFSMLLSAEAIERFIDG